MILLQSLSTIPWWLLWLLPFLLGLLLGWIIWFKYKARTEENLVKIDGMRNHIADLERDLDDCWRKSVETRGKLADLEEKLHNDQDVEGDMDRDIQRASDENENQLSGQAPEIHARSSGAEVYHELSKDNLQIIDGIGPKMESVLKENGISNWQALANQTQEDLNSILLSYGHKYQMIDPSSWSKQATLAKDGQWDELIRLQKGFTAGHQDPKVTPESKLEKMLIKLGLQKKYQQDDLKAIEGIGAKIAALLHEAGITNWQHLAETPVNQLQEILNAAGPRFKLADPGTWPRQAELAASGRWKELQEYQKDLTGGK